MYKDVNGKTGFRGLTGVSGKTYGNLKLFSSDELVEALNDGITEVIPTPEAPVNLDKLKEKRKKTINSERDQAIASGFEYAVDTVSYGMFDCDPVSVAKITGAVANLLAGSPLPDGFSWRNADNLDVPMDDVLLKGLGAAAATHVYTQHMIARQLKQAIEDATTEEEVDAVVWPWPAEEVVV